MIKLFCGFDQRESAGTHVFVASVMRHASQPVAYIPLNLLNLQNYTEQHRDGSNAFIYSRFLVPWLAGWHGFAIFADGADMLCRADITQLWKMADRSKAVQVVKHDYLTQYTRKYLGTRMEAPNDNYSRKNWSSLMLINCQHPSWRQITPETIGDKTGAQLHRFTFLDDDDIGELPGVWNHLVMEYPHDPFAKIAHFTLGVPAFKAYQFCPFAEEWRGELTLLNAVTD